MSYARFAATIAVSTIVLFGLRYLNTNAADHVFLSQTRVWTAVIMGAAMAVIMLLFMWDMYDNKTAMQAFSSAQPSSSSDYSGWSLRSARCRLEQRRRFYALTYVQLPRSCPDRTA